ncbi:hypothetical protein AAC03nite_38780 [Alicyclobacillus acidoterrestris]|uniref:hypothetical protein n=1 Tax=Alicyclobacillus suci TaxID=2816080 RepID=UPI00118F139E|nr:hypothetical protein [Alicyclobacillus suci]GEO28093.1 hypothetical protein AAC03nite_38780 [Alicyclobacillus acidoterrestris]
MNSEREILEKLSLISSMQMSVQKQDEIWNNIEQEMKKTKFRKSKRGFTMFSNIAAVVVALAVVTGGIGYEAHTNQSKQIPTPHVTTASNSKNNKQHLNMTPQKLASYNVKHGQPLPFAGQNVTRSVPKQALSITNPNSASMFGATIQTKNAGSFPSNQFKVIDRWTGSIQEQSFTIEIDKKSEGNKYIIGVASGSKETAYAFNQQPWITNFTGDYMVFATPNPAQGNPIFAINLNTGVLTQPSQITREMSSAYPGMGGYSTMISGLPQQYSALPNG